METSNRPASRGPSAGFSLIELLTVVTIIVVMAAVVSPNISQYIRNYRIRGEANELATNLQKARNKAIMKNASLGVSVVIDSPTTYWVHLEDDQLDATDMTKEIARQPLNVATPDPAQSTRFRLGNNVQFAVNAAECPSAPGGFAPTTDRLRFSRLGAWCSPGLGGCAVVNGPGGPPYPPLPPFGNFIRTGPTGSLVCVTEPVSGLSRWISITAGGRIAAQQ
jgi:prepilin-type N-terminal cleavage/methylation domain-containing protein